MEGALSHRADPFLAVSLVIDTREQRPYDFGAHPSLREALNAGDYSLSGFEDRVAVERKAPGDILHCIGGDRGRFERELERLAELDFAALVIEANLVDLLGGGSPPIPPGPALRSSASCRRLHPSSILGSLAAWSVRYGIGVWFAGDWVSGREVTYRLLRHWWRGLSLPRGEGDR